MQSGEWALLGVNNRAEEAFRRLGASIINTRIDARKGTDGVDVIGLPALSKVVYAAGVELQIASNFFLTGSMTRVDFAAASAAARSSAYC